MPTLAMLVELSQTRQPDTSVNIATPGLTCGPKRAREFAGAEQGS